MLSSVELSMKKLYNLGAGRVITEMITGRLHIKFYRQGVLELMII